MKDNPYTQTDPLIYKNKIHFLPCKLYLYQNKNKMLLELKFKLCYCHIFLTVWSY